LLLLHHLLKQPFFNPFHLHLNLALHESLLHFLVLLHLYLHLQHEKHWYHDAEDANAALLTSLDAIDETNFSINLTFEPLFSEREFFILTLDNEESTLSLEYFSVAGCCCCC
jgi:hypothetical protein